jgi:hypothetical protein
MKLDFVQNQFLLTVKSLRDEVVIVNSVPSALNGWKPQANGKRGLFLDCRPGTEAIYDALEFTQPDGKRLLSFDFEAPGFVDGQDIVDAPVAAGSLPWMVTGFCQAPATSKANSAVALDPAVQAAMVRLTAARNALRLPTMKIDAAEARVAAAEKDLQSLSQRIEADSTRYSTGLLLDDRQADPAVKAMIHGACQTERESAVAAAKASLMAAEVAIALAEVKILAASKSSDQAAIDAANKEKQTAETTRTAATTALNTANGNLAKGLDDYTALSPKYPQISSGRRTVLARWIADKNNPLTARVAVNHIWLRHFGQAIVETTHDLGRNGSRPTHPELLDWLACELMDSGWSMKHIHRLIVTSETYQMASMLPQSAGEVAAAIVAKNSTDADNKTYWRFPASRMQAEVVRDSLLSIAGELDPTMGGHEIDHKDGMTSRRRSLYFAHHGEEKMEFLELFDAANACDCYKRTSSVQPQQALALTNSELTKSLSRALAKRLWDKVSALGERSSDEFIQQAFLQVLNRQPRDAEFQASKDFLEQQSVRLVAATSESTADFDAAVRSRENLVHALMNHNDFVTVR